ncbi:MAG: hypothetical protein NVSMB27_23080 [Ktedonobacteraceae bacterium]
MKTALSTFPEVVKQGTRRLLQAHRQSYLSDLRTFAARADWLMFHSTIIDAVRITMQALFAANNVYYPGDKWLHQSIRCFALPTEVSTLYDQLWRSEENTDERIAALIQLMELVNGQG